MARAGLHIEIRGTVQGVGYRPWVYQLASRIGIGGRVWNHARGVSVDAFGTDEALQRFVAALRSDAPPAARVSSVTCSEVPPAEQETFAIEKSIAAGERSVSIPADLATCDDCLRELLDPADRRFRYPFINCTNCGPRYSIVSGAPYDRAATSMAPFTMCRACRREYDWPLDRRFHAQPNACPACGPRLMAVTPRGQEITTADPIQFAARAIRAGFVVAVKGLGGFHLACDATSPTSVQRLRERKHRQTKPFAVMVRDLAEAETLAMLSDEERALLASTERPIVLAMMRQPGIPRGCEEILVGPPAQVTLTERIASSPLTRPSATLSPPFRPALRRGEGQQTALSARVSDREPSPLVKGEGCHHLNRGEALIGLFLPYTPLHHLLLEDAGVPLVMTSGNVSDEPMVTTNEDALAQLGEIADVFLLHDREIVTRVDDSVVRMIGRAPVLLRRARGFVPRAIETARSFAEPILACGAHLKNTFCIAAGHSAFLGPHIGDLESVATLHAYETAIERMKEFVGVWPRVVAHDLHPDYFSTRYALAQEGMQTMAVQHHHAHIASVMAEHALEGPVVGVAYDGTGFGTDGTLWGGEILIAEYDHFERFATFRPIALAGGDQAIHQPWRAALALLDDAFGEDAPLEVIPLFRQLPTTDVEAVRRMIARNFNITPARGIGRYFDAIGALVLGMPFSSYEGEVAFRWNMIAGDAERGRYPIVIRDGAAPWEVDPRPIVRGVVDDLLAGCSPAAISGRFHNTLAAATVEIVRAALAVHGDLPVVLSGGCFQNAHLAESIIDALQPDARVFMNGDVPPGDGGIALGQAWIADAKLRAGVVEEEALACV